MSEQRALWPPVVQSRPLRSRRLRLIKAGDVQVQRIPLATVQIRGAVCPACFQPLPVGERAAIRAGVLVHVRQQCLRS